MYSIHRPTFDFQFNLTKKIIVSHIFKSLHYSKINKLFEKKNVKKLMKKNIRY